jgi:hypothetical protein
MEGSEFLRLLSLEALLILELGDDDFQLPVDPSFEMQVEFVSVLGSQR